MIPGARSAPALRLAFVAILALGVALRFWGFGEGGKVGFDENLYRAYTAMVAQKGIGGYPDILAAYIAKQKETPTPLLPPTRLTFLLGAGGIHAATGLPPVEAVRLLSALGGSALLVLGGVFAWRAGGPAMGLGVAALLAAAPLQLHIAHRAWIDGFFALWATSAAWALWEGMQTKRPGPWAALYGLSLALMVMTKENAIFAYPALVAPLLANRWLRFGEAAKPLWAAALIGPAAGVIGLALFSGGFGPLLEALSLNRAASYHPEAYGIRTGDGPWHRYLVELFLVSPLAMLLAVGALFALRREDRAGVWMALFFGATYLAMCWVRYGINLRYGNIWDFPLRWLAMGMILRLASGLPARWRGVASALAVAAVASQDFSMYWRLFVVADIYDPIPAAMLRALDFVK